jgi:hypothetical protein
MSISVEATRRENQQRPDVQVTLLAAVRELAVTIARAAWVMHGCKLVGHVPSRPDAWGIRSCERCFEVLPPVTP